MSVLGQHKLAGQHGAEQVREGEGMAGQGRSGQVKAGLNTEQGLAVHNQNPILQVIQPYIKVSSFRRP